MENADLEQQINANHNRVRGTGVTTDLQDALAKMGREDVADQLIMKVIECLLVEPRDLARAEAILRLTREFLNLSVTRIGQLEPIGGIGMAAPVIARPYGPPAAEQALSELVDVTRRASQPKPPALADLVTAYAGLRAIAPDLAQTQRMLKLIDRTISRIEEEGGTHEDLHPELPG